MQRNAEDLFKLQSWFKFLLGATGNAWIWSPILLPIHKQSWACLWLCFVARFHITRFRFQISVLRTSSIFVCVCDSLPTYISEMSWHFNWLGHINYKTLTVPSCWEWKREHILKLNNQNMIYEQFRSLKYSLAVFWRNINFVFVCKLLIRHRSNNKI